MQIKMLEIEHGQTYADVFTVADAVVGTAPSAVKYKTAPASGEEMVNENGTLAICAYSC
jgi:hypothetical protein